MNKEIRSIVIKSVIFIVVFIISSIIISTFEPLLNTEVAIQQMNGGSDGFAQLTLYNNLKIYSVYGYILFFFILFSTNIARAIKQLANKLKSNY